MHAFIITGGSREKRRERIIRKLNEWKINQFDIRELTPDESSIGIARVRQFTSHLSLAPSGALSVGIISDAELLTQEAQNALLKTLEEPPGHARIILETQTIDTLLPTILSRCLVTSLGVSDTFSRAEHEAWLAAWSTLVSQRPGVVLGAVEVIAASRGGAQRWVICGIEALHRALDTQSAQAIGRLLKAQVQLAANVTPKLVIDLCILG